MADLSIHEKLTEIAGNLWWSWQPEVTQIFREIDPVRWSELKHSPIPLLKENPPEVLEAKARAMVLHSRVNWAYRRMHEYLSTKLTWGAANAGTLGSRPCAYFSAEFGLHESLPIYSGGLGVLSGDHMKAEQTFLAGNLNLRRLTIHGSRFLPTNDLQFLDEGFANLTFIDLRKNYIQKVDSTLFTDLPSLDEVKIGGNNVSCSDCQTLGEISELLTLNLTSEVDLACLVGHWSPERKNLTSVYLDDCTDPDGSPLQALMPFMVFLTLMLVLVVICACVWLRGQGHGGFRGQLYAEVDGEFDFDAFVSYAEEDSAFVMDVLKHLR